MVEDLDFQSAHYNLKSKQEQFSTASLLATFAGTRPQGIE